MTTPVVLRFPQDTSPTTVPEKDHLRGTGYVVVAIAAFVLGVIIGQLGERPPEGSRGHRPSPSAPVRPHPRSFQP